MYMSATGGGQPQYVDLNGDHKSMVVRLGPSVENCVLFKDAAKIFGHLSLVRNVKRKKG